MKKYQAVTTEQVFQLMCNSDVCIMNYQTKIIPSTVMAKILKTSKYKIKKCLNELREKGFVTSGCENIYSSWYEQYFIVRGYYLTSEAKKTETYKEAEQKEIELINKSFCSNDLKEGAE